jgi:hypothetical protein
MVIRFAELIRLPAGEVYDYFKSPADWVRLFGLAGDVRVLEDGWIVVPLARFPFPLVARVTASEPNRLVRWTFRGFWRGEGEVRLVQQLDGVLVEGCETISPRRLPLIGPLLERAFMQREFERIWALGWKRLRRREQGARDAPG